MVYGQYIHFSGWTGNGNVIVATTSVFATRSNVAQSDLASAMPTAGGLYWWTHYFAGPRWKNPLSFLIGYSNTLDLIGGVCSVDCKSNLDEGDLF